MEQLEDRSLLATIIVTTELDLVNAGDGVTSLREAVIQANNQTTNPGADTITFASALANKAILLISGQFSITDAVTILGLGTDRTTVNGQNASRLFDITSAASSVTFDGLTLTGGRTTIDRENGGAIRSAAAALNVQNSTITGNSTVGESSFGGGISAGPATTTTITNNTISGNSATTGGGIFITGGPTTGGSLVVRDSTISGNSAGSGGGIFSYSGGVQGGSVTITNSTISGNTAGNSGGGMIAFMATITNSTITGNSAGSSGGGVASQTTMTIRNSIVAKNVDADGSHPDFQQTNNNGNGPPIVQHSLIGDNNGSGLTAANPDANGNKIGSHAVPIDPRLGPLQNNAGRTNTHALLTGSPAINAGNNSLAVDPAAQAVLIADQRGAPYQRIVHGTVDMGAIEAQPMVVDTDVDEDDANAAPGRLSLRDAVRITNTNVGADTITFAPSFFNTPRVIDLGFGHLTISDDLTLTGTGSNLLTINGQNNSRLFDIASTATNVTIEGLTLTGGRTTANSQHGGAIRWRTTTGQLSVRNSTITGNSTAGTFSGGGGIFTDGSLTLINSTVSGNSTAGQSSGGGGINASPVTIINSTISGNSTTGDFARGGGVFTLTAATILNSTITGNSVAGIATGSGTDGGGLNATDGPVIIRNSIIAGNLDIQGGSHPDLRQANNGPPTVQFSLIGDNNGTGLAAAPVGSPNANGNLIGTHAAPINPQLGPLSNNGGPFLTHTLCTGASSPVAGCTAASPALNAGSNALLPADTSDRDGDGDFGEPIPFDQRGLGFVRVFNAVVDMGAFELQPTFPWHNFAKPLDVNGGPNNAPDNSVDPGDALSIINYINAFPAVAVPANAIQGQPFGFLDVTGNNEVTPEDALSVINAINAGIGGKGEGGRELGVGNRESGGWSQESGAAEMEELIALLAADLPMPRRARQIY